MDLIGSMVEHKVFGVGIITDFDGTYFNVKFENKVVMFSYPDAFASFLTFCNEKRPEKITKDILRHEEKKKERKEKIQKKKKKEAEKRKKILAEERKPKRGRRKIRKAKKKDSDKKNDKK